MISNFSLTVLLVLILSCSDKAGLNSSSSVRGKNDSSNQNSIGGSGSSITESFKFGVNNTPTDILIVFDNSVSMKEYVDRVRLGFERLATSTWKGDVKIGVMTTLPGNPANLNKVHDFIAASPDALYRGLENEPGFLSLVSAAGLSRYLATAQSPQRDAYPDPLCESEWFSPQEKNKNNKACLSVALQNPFHPVVCEAGMTSLGQILDKRPKLFRTASYVQILFVSDAQDPGCAASQALIANRPSETMLMDKIKANSRSIEVRFHGIVPIEGTVTKETTRDGTFGFPYNKAINATKGIIYDIAGQGDYSGILSQVANSTAKDPKFILESPAAEIMSVAVNEKNLTSSQYQLASDQKTLRIPSLETDKNSIIIVKYKKK